MDKTGKTMWCLHTSESTAGHTAQIVFLIFSEDPTDMSGHTRKTFEKVIYQQEYCCKGLAGLRAARLPATTATLLWYTVFLHAFTGASGNEIL